MVQMFPATALCGFFARGAFGGGVATGVGVAALMVSGSAMAAGTRGNDEDSSSSEEEGEWRPPVASSVAVSPVANPIVVARGTKRPASQALQPPQLSIQGPMLKNCKAQWVVRDLASGQRSCGGSKEDAQKIAATWLNSGIDEVRKQVAQRRKRIARS